MERAALILEDLRAAMFVIAGVIAVARWARRRGRADAWIAAMFGSLAAIVVAARLVPMEGPGSEAAWVSLVTKALVVVLVAFPYLAFRFGETFGEARAWVRRAALALSVLTALALIPVEVATVGEPRSRGFVWWIVLFLVQWVTLSSSTALRLLRGARRQPPVARRRMVTMAAGFIILSAILLVSGGAPRATDIGAREIVVDAAGLLAAPALLLGFAPPGVLVWVWRRRDELALREAEASLLRARSPAEVGAALLPHATRLVGGSASVLLGRDGSLLASFGPAEQVENLVGARHGRVHEIAGEHATLRVDLSPFAPYFGSEELKILHTLGSFADLALARSELLAEQARNLATLQAANETLRDFVAIASHDLRTPLSIIQGLVDVLADHWEIFEDAARHEQIAAVRRQAEHLARLVEDLLTVSKLDAGAVEADPRVIDVRSALDEIVADIGAGTDVRISAPAGLEVVADAEHLRRMISNYLQNAKVYGAPPIEIEARAVRGSIEIRVIDHGPGVPAGFRPRMFQKFARADRRMSKGAGGTGLGLAIVRGLARADGGDAWFEPRSGGACFVVALPGAAREAITA